MQEIVEQMPLIGYYPFSSKDKTQTYYVVQFLHTEEDLSKNTKRSTPITCFVEQDVYGKICEMDIGTVFRVEIKPNLETGKISYRPII